MTNEPTNFLPLSGFGGFDYLTAGTQPSEKGVAPAQRNTIRLWDQAGDPKWLGRGELVVNDFSLQGLNHPEGDFSMNSNGYTWSDLVTNRANELVPPPATLTLTDASISSPFVGIHTAFAHSTLFIGIGDAVDHSLFKETSATNPTPVALTYTPGGAICSLTRTLTSGAERLMVGHVGAAAKLVSDSSGTVATTMNAATASLWGGVLSGVNADPTKAGVPQINMYYGTNLGYLSSDATMTNAPTNSHTVNAGGFAIGAIKAAGRAQMCYWAIPRATNTSGALASGAYCDIYATPMDMSADFLPVDLSYYLPNGIIWAMPFRDGILAHDGKHVVYWDGDDVYDLGLLGKRIDTLNSKSATTTGINHDAVYSVRGLIVRGSECGAFTTVMPADETSPNGYMYADMYNFETGAWHNVHTRVDVGAASNLNVPLVAGSTISPSGSRYWAYNNNSGTITGFFIPRTGESLLWQHSIGSGATTTGIPQFTHNTSLMGPRWRLDAPPPGTIPGFKTIARMPKVIYEVEFNGNLDYGAGDWDFQIQVYGYGIDGTTRHKAFDFTFEQGMPSAHYVHKNPPSAWANIFDLQLFLTAVASGLTRKSAQLVPFTVRFAYSKDGREITQENAPSLYGPEV